MSGKAAATPKRNCGFFHFLILLSYPCKSVPIRWPGVVPNKSHQLAIASKIAVWLTTTFPATSCTMTKLPYPRGPQVRAAMLVAIAADALQLVLMPLFVEGALSPVDDLLDFGVGAMMIHLLGWHWEFLPSFFTKLVPGVDLVSLLDDRGDQRLA